MRISDWSSDVCSSDLPFLNDSKLTNVEARYEYYFAPEQRFTLAGFYKKIENPIEAFSYFNNGLVTSFANAPQADLYGAAVEMLHYVPLGGIPGRGVLSPRDRTRVVSGQCVLVRVEPGEGRSIRKKKD